MSAPSRLSNALLRKRDGRDGENRGGGGRRGEGGGGSLAFSPDSTVLAASFGRHVSIWDHSSSSLLTTVSLGGSVSTLKFAKDGTDRLLCAGDRFVALRSPFGDDGGGVGGGGGGRGDRRYLGVGGEWSYSLPSSSSKDGGGAGT